MLDEEALGGVAFVGRVLGPFFHYDPKRQAAQVGPLYAEMARLDARQAAQDWPFVEPGTAFGALATMQDALDDDLDEDELAWEYRRLFVGPGKKAVPPWGSVYTDRDGVMFGTSWVDLRTWLRANGIGVDGSASGEPEDHIGTMLELMAWIADNRPGLLGDYLRLHLLTWSGHFLDELEEEARHPFFGGLAALTHASLDGIGRGLSLEVETPRFYR